MCLENVRPLRESVQSDFSLRFSINELTLKRLLVEIKAYLRRSIFKVDFIEILSDLFCKMISFSFIVIFLVTAFSAFPGANLLDGLHQVSISTGSILIILKY